MTSTGSGAGSDEGSGGMPAPSPDGGTTDGGAGGTTEPMHEDLGMGDGKDVVTIGDSWMQLYTAGIEVAAGDGLVQRVSADIAEHMRRGSASAQRSAARLGMSRRTLTRQLALHGTSYSELLKEARADVTARAVDEVRRALAQPPAQTHRGER